MQGNECLNDYININPNKPLFCLDCQNGQYFLQDLNICQSIQPPSASYTCYSEKNYQTCVPCYSINYCQKCERISGEIMCLLCESNYYLYKNSCQISQIQPSIATGTAFATVIIFVVSSDNGSSNFKFLTLQKLNLLYMVNILFTPELTVFINQIKDTNPLLYFQKINFFSKHIFVESLKKIEDQGYE